MNEIVKTVESSVKCSWLPISNAIQQFGLQFCLQMMPNFGTGSCSWETKSMYIDEL
jgi:hypothetical protein